MDDGALAFYRLRRCHGLTPEFHVSQLWMAEMIAAGFAGSRLEIAPPKPLPPEMAGRFYRLITSPRLPVFRVRHPDHAARIGALLRREIVVIEPRPLPLVPAGPALTPADAD